MTEDRDRQTKISLFERVLAENTELARTLAIREKSSIGAASIKKKRPPRHVEERQRNVVLEVGGSSLKARQINNNLDWICGNPKCKYTNFARVVVCQSCGQTVDQGAQYLTGKLKAQKRYEMMMRLSRN